MDALAFRRVLVLAPHSDDAELGCGGTLARLVDAGAEVHHVALSSCELAPPPLEPADAPPDELADAARALGLSDGNAVALDYPVRHFPSRRQEILEELVALRARLAPDLVLVPASDDTHQDHQVVAAEGFRAFKYTTVLGYELPWNQTRFGASCFVPLDERALDRKLAAVACYRSQAHRPYFDPDNVRALARVRGLQAGVTYAEAFEVVRWMWPLTSPSP